jgi:enoyl-CoA hydratase
LETIPLFKKRGRTGIVIFNRPTSQCLKPKVFEELTFIFQEMEKDPEVKVDFNRGVDLFGVSRYPDAFQSETERRMPRPPGKTMPTTSWKIWESRRLYRRILAWGHAELALCCDFRIAADNAKFGLPEVKLGVLPEGGTPKTSRLIDDRAKELIFLGDLPTARRPIDWGCEHGGP